MSAPATTIHTVQFPAGFSVPALGQGTWHMGEDPDRYDEEVESLRLGLDLGMSLIDTAEMYGDGAAEEVVGEAIRGRRDGVFLVSKVLPHHATSRGVVTACIESLKRLNTDRLDLYLLHWRGNVPLEETLDGFAELMREGAIRCWGVSNFDISDMEELVTIPGGEDVQTDQVLYNLARRGIEYDLLPWCNVEALPVMAYSPIEQGRLLAHPTLVEIAARHDATESQVALAWVLLHRQVIAIPKAATRAHVRENFGALNVRLTRQDLRDLDRAFPRPMTKRALEML
jgi:diketogulonate reductase-like aldo/keto reductase